MFIQTVFIFLTFNNSVFADNIHKDCIEWFKKSKIKIDSNCELKCAAHGTDMGTFGCENSCEDLCNKPSEDSDMVKAKKYLTDYYYAFSEDEKKIIKENPKEALTAYYLWKNYGRNTKHLWICRWAICQ